MSVGAAAGIAVRKGGGRNVAGYAAAIVGALLVLLLSMAPRAAQAQVSERTVRLTITEVGDSTFSFDAANLRWIKPGARGMAVDPKRRDALVARFAVLRVANGRATAVITGETTELSPEHVVVMEAPIRPWYRSSLFWGGATFGMLLGVLARSF